MIRYIVTQLQSHHQKDTSSIIAPTLFDWNSSINLILMTAFKQFFFFYPNTSPLFLTRAKQIYSNEQFLIKLLYTFEWGYRGWGYLPNLSLKYIRYMHVSFLRSKQPSWSMKEIYDRGKYLKQTIR